MLGVPSDKNSSIPIEALSGPRATAYEIIACKALTKRCGENSFAFAGARMPLELVPHKDQNGILGVEMFTGYTNTKFTVPVKPIFYDIDIAGELAAIKAKVDAFVVTNEEELTWQLSAAVEGLQVSLNRGEKVNGSLVQQPNSLKTRVVTTTDDLLDDTSDGFLRGIGTTSASPLASPFELFLLGNIVRDVVKDSRYFYSVLERFWVATRAMRVTPKHAVAVAALMNTTVDESKIAASFAYEAKEIVERPKTPFEPAKSIPLPPMPAIPVPAAPLPPMPVAAPVAPASPPKAPKPEPKPEPKAESDEDSESDDDDDDYEEEEVKPKMVASKRGRGGMRGRPGRPRKQAKVEPKAKKEDSLASDEDDEEEAPAQVVKKTFKCPICTAGEEYDHRSCYYEAVGQKLVVSHDDFKKLCRAQIRARAAALG